MFCEISDGRVFRFVLYPAEVGNDSRAELDVSDVTADF